MPRFQEQAADLLDRNATALAGHAAQELLENHPDTAQRFGPGAFGIWKAHLTARLQELAVAVEFASPELFAQAVDWARGAFAARNVPEQDLQQSLAALRKTLAAELPEGVAATVDASFDRADAALGRTTSEPLGDAPDHRHQELALRYLEACLSGNPPGAIQQLLDAVDAGLDIEEAFLQVLGFAQHEIGQLWHAGKVGVHEEHLVTTTTMAAMTLLAHRAAPAPSVNATVLGAAPGDDAHEVGIRMILHLFEIAGWRSLCLGARMPAEDLAHAADDFRADLLVLSATLIPHLIPLREAIGAVRSLRPEVKVLVGGRAFQAAPGVWRQVGADGFAARASEAVDTGSRLLEPLERR